jgi:hypothetical protein
VKFYNVLVKQRAVKMIFFYITAKAQRKIPLSFRRGVRGEVLNQWRGK